MPAHVSLNQAWLHEGNTNWANVHKIDWSYCQLVWVFFSNSSTSNEILQHQLDQQIEELNVKSIEMSSEACCQHIIMWMLQTAFECTNDEV